MAIMSRIPIFLVFYIIAFFNIKLTHQVEGGNSFLIIPTLTIFYFTNNYNVYCQKARFFVDGRNPLDLVKCPANSTLYYLQAYAVCKTDVNNINDQTKVWFVPEHGNADKRAGQDTVENCKASQNSLIKAYYDYCESVFNENKKCTLAINKENSDSDRFRTEDGLDCANQGKSIFNGVLFCIQTDGSAVKENEEVTLVGFKGVPLEPACPEDRKIQTLTAFTYGPKLTNKGFVDSFLGEARNKCDGNEHCSLDFEDTGRFFRYRIYTYKCVQ
ncbi:uncharacterized protein TA06030 [Theileria annulata]|uniref:Uncharacterized protein n=1 Tax=Theileria annulata TaxID=5874 RepID=Q4UI45_THEAN|nr:uncharacterized protein TA06030 [Theileria annulata]CAI73244.1 hypothetical protein TA06030 [Theileria annulata]|eukprot:XP_953921.1 hypothetical protein TA06030 [Theileria annulata]